MDVMMTQNRFSVSAEFGGEILSFVARCHLADAAVIRSASGWLEAGALGHVMAADALAHVADGVQQLSNFLIVQCYIPEDLVAAQGCRDLVRLLQLDMIVSARAISFLDVFFGISEEGVDRVMHDLGVRAVCTLVSDGELHSELRRWLQDISRKARSRISRPFMSGLSKALALGSSEQRKAAITLLASLVGRWQQQHQVLTLLFQAAQTDPSESNRVVAVDSIAFLQEKHAKSDPTLAAAVAANCQRVLCALAARDNNAEVRCAAIDALNPMRSDEILLSDTAKLLCERLSDRSVKTRTKAALCLSSWGPERLEKTLTISDWKPSKVRESIEPLVVSSLQGRNGLTLLRQLDLLKKNSPHEAFLRTHAAEIFPLILKNHAEATRNHHTVASGYDVGQVLLSDSDN